MACHHTTACISIFLLCVCCSAVLSQVPECNKNEFYNNETAHCHPCHCEDNQACTDLIGCADQLCAEGWLHPPACQSPQDPSDCPDAFLYYSGNTTETSDGRGECLPCRCLVSSRCELTGCSDGRCTKGWSNPPACNTECNATHWGSNCALQCHCQEGNMCSSVNGLCSPNGDCHEDWLGPGCQTRLPELVNPPVITHVGCESVTVTFTQWQEGKDIGHPEVGQYILQWQINSTTNSTTDESPPWLSEVIGFEPSVSVYERTLVNLSTDSTYTFRVVTNRTQFGYITVGGLSPTSEPVVPTCTVTTNAPTTITTTTEERTSTSPSQATTSTTEGTLISTSSERTTVVVTVAGVGGVWVDLSSPNGEVTVHWESLSDGDITGYNLTYQLVAIGNCQTVDSESAVSVMEAVSEISYLLTDLLPWRQYNVTVSGLTETTGDTDVVHLGSVHFTTKPTAPTSSPSNLDHDALGTTSLELTWTQVPCAERGGTLQYYRVEAIDADDPEVPRVAVLSVETERAVVSNLVPYVTYGFRVRMVNEAGSGPFSGYYHRRTNEAVPPAPRDVQVVTVSTESISMTWLPPHPPHGVLQGYKIQYRVHVDDSEVFTINQQATSRILADLQPYTEYAIQIQAMTRVGWGNWTGALIVRTEEGIPSAPRQISMRFRNTSCLSVEWDEPVRSHGPITLYQVTYKAKTILSASAVDPSEQEVETPNTHLDICDLDPAVQYKVRVTAKTNSGVWGEASMVFLWTEGGVPEIPPKPVFVSVRLAYITIEISSVSLREGPISGYLIVVDTATNSNTPRRKRSIPDPAENIPLPGYTAALISPENVRTKFSFAVGDGYTYGGYKNRALESHTNYSIALVIASTVDDMTKFSYAYMEDTVQTEYITTSTKQTDATPTAPDKSTTTPVASTAPDKSTTTPVASTAPDKSIATITTTEASTLRTSTVQSKNISSSSRNSEPEKSSSKTSVIVAVVFVIFAILLVILVIIWCRWKKGQHKAARYQSSEKDWLSYYSKNYQKDTGKKSEHWTDTFSLNESKNTVSVDEVKYSPVDVQVSEIHHNRPDVSYEEEYRQLPYGQHYMWDVALRHENKDRNHYDHILAYDQSRVILKGKQGGNYINANYIHGYGRNKAYIAAQSPFNEKTVYDFWYMIYQENVAQIVFLDRRDEAGSSGKVTKYWPSAGAVKYDDIAVKHIETELYANFLIRRLDIFLEGHSVKEVTQYQYLVWPEHGLPDDPIPLLTFRLKVRMDQAPNRTVPLVAHCDTGVSRSAIYIALDSLLEEAKMEHSINVFRFCHQMRHSRVNMIRTVKQYVFLYEALFEALITNYNLIGDTLKMNYKQLSQVNPINNKSYFMEQFEILEKYIRPAAPEDCKAGLLECNRTKNRNQGIVPLDKYRPVLKQHGLGRSDYINAVYVDSYLSQNSFIVTQNPMDSTVVDFWRLVYEKRVSVIVMLSKNDNKTACVEYWPRESGQVARWGTLEVRLVEEFDEEHCTVRTLKVWDTDAATGQDQREVQHFQFEAWKLHEKKPWSRDGFIQLIEAVEDIQEESNTFTDPVLVHCLDGASRSGLYCACALICEIIREEEQVDAFHTIKHIKNRRPQFVNSYEQYKFVFKLLWDYMNTRLEKKGALPPGNQSKSVSDPDLKDTYTVQQVKAHEVCIG